MRVEYLERVRERKPLIHCITNYVTVNDVANVVLAAGASPIMADDPGEVEEITARCDGLCVNIGTLKAANVESMCRAGKRANALNHAVVLDPVGAGVSTLRAESARRILSEVRFTAIRGNLSEFRALFDETGDSRGVDAAFEDRMDGGISDALIDFAKRCARKSGAVCAITGATDLVTDGETAFLIRNGHEMMGKITGSGCQLSALVCAYLAVSPEDPLGAAAAAVCHMGLAGEIAADRMGRFDGNASYRNYLIDAVYCMTAEMLQKGARCERR